MAALGGARVSDRIRIGGGPGAVRPARRGLANAFVGVHARQSALRAGIRAQPPSGLAADSAARHRETAVVEGGESFALCAAILRRTSWPNDLGHGPKLATRLPSRIHR